MVKGHLKGYSHLTGCCRRQLCSAMPAHVCLAAHDPASSDMSSFWLLPHMQPRKLLKAQACQGMCLCRSQRKMSVSARGAAMHPSLTLMVADLLLVSQGQPMNGDFSCSCKPARPTRSPVESGKCFCTSSSEHAGWPCWITQACCISLQQEVRHGNPLVAHSYSRHRGTSVTVFHDCKASCLLHANRE